MTRLELIKLGEKIVSGNESEEQLNELMDLFGKHVPHPSGAGLFYYPENYNARKDDISKYNPTVEDVVDKALAYKPIQL
ncbi:bacteriocin immunity protein [Olleya sp. R77988]|uniref:bacteriocin immunity protein n=1 Tax=Olleya sp. R77988 TaxID=3093875 RepID=UPI0037C888A5